MRILFQNGLLYDGTQAPPQKADLLVQDDRVEAVGRTLAVEADRVVDCEGLCITPGWIDAHSHNDFFFDWEDAETYYRPFIQQGITTQVTGNCGFSVFGVEADTPHRDAVGSGLFHARKAGSYADFVHAAEGNLHVNIAPLIGHGTARISVSGLSPRALTPGELARELALVEEAMAGGAFGGSLGLMYEPGMYAPREELVAFARAVAAHDGILTVHPRANSRVAMGYSLLAPSHIELALDEVIAIQRASGVRVEYSHLIFVGATSWRCVDAMLKKFHDAKAEGLELGFDQYAFPYGASVITVICPPWYMALSPSQKKSPWNRMRLRMIVDITRKLLGIEYRDITVAYLSDDARQYEGRTIEEIARTEHMHPLDLYLKLIDLSGGQGRVYLGKYYNDAILRRLMEDDLSILMTDAWVEGKGVQNGSAFQCFPKFLKMAEAWDIPTEQVIHKMTGETARRFHIPERGLLRPGYFADVTVFDPNRLAVNPDQPDNYPQGLRHVLVNGVFAVEDGVYRPQCAGRVLYKAQ